jgi:hypothetical protein
VAKKIELDFLDEMIAERTRRNPNFPKLLAAAVRKRKADRKKGKL